MIGNFLRGLATVLIAWAALAAIVKADDIIQTTRIASGLSRPLYVTSPPGDDDHLFIVEQHTGQIRILNLDDNTIEATPFLTIGGLATGGEQGLLGLAFHPDYATNGQFYVNLTASAGGQTQIRRYTRSATNPLVANPLSVQTVLTYAQPESNHNGGWLGFNPRVNAGDPQYLHISSGDGGGGNDQHGTIGNAQDTTSNLLGKILRIDVNGDDFPTDATRNYAIPPTNPFAGATVAGDDEIWNYGLRNPWRAGFDRQTGDLFIGDVGQSAREEIDFEPRGVGGRNYGWRVMEGTRCNIATDPLPCNSPAFTPPVHEYPRSDGFSVTGGYVYRGPLAPLQGNYFFADYGSARIWSFRYDGVTKTNFIERTPQIVTNAGTINEVSSFGEDNAGNVYIVDLGGEVFRIDSVIQTENLVAAGATWQYLDNGSNQGTAWRDRLFEDSTWRTGAGQFGYGEGDEVTTIDCGPANGNECTPTVNNQTNKYITTYFRHHFNVDEPTEWESLTLGLLRDDGAAVYLNGEEIVRTANLSPTAMFDTLANLTGAVGGADESRFFTFPVDPDMLLSGENVLAVEIHQHAQNSSDVSFDLRLSGIRSPSTPGDVNGDGVVDRDDVVIVIENYGLDVGATRSQGDLSGDGRVGLDDLAMLQENFGSGPGAAVPEPATWLATLAGLALVVAFRRRKTSADFADFTDFVQ
jgi:glucose/arabinose dehydrogenase